MILLYTFCIDLQMFWNGDIFLSSIILLSLAISLHVVVNNTITSVTFATYNIIMCVQYIITCFTLQLIN